MLLVIHTLVMITLIVFLIFIFDFFMGLFLGFIGGVLGKWRKIGFGGCVMGFKVASFDCFIVSVGLFIPNNSYSISILTYKSSHLPKPPLSS